ncbi:uncharacterized protein PAC_08405 [Phialocephala subalpina]|uniref:Uncharacterized protein n=1 Tax=Phialocephala subalpina TaxID=576137 RepID=A0A1L7X0H6_9HELO|nr:uncharacterized protein PAC_08405 [Phialocephala subalpina]
METLERARRQHTKSRKGYIQCKKRHERCDEFPPQWQVSFPIIFHFVDVLFSRNCWNEAQRGSTCKYPESVRPKGSAEPDVHQIISAREAKTSSTKLEDTSLAQRISPYELSSTDLRLMQHLLFVSGKLEASGTSKMAVWTAQIPNFVSMSKSHDMVKHSILALSAAHLGWIIRSRDLGHISLLHQTAAFRELQKAIDEFSPENCDAVLASSLILQWQASNCMHLFNFERRLLDVDADHLKDAGADESNPMGPNKVDYTRSNFCIESLKKAEDFMTQTEELANLHKGLLSFTENLRNFPPGPKASQQYRTVYPKRVWLFWMPISFTNMDKGDINTLLSFAYFNATMLAVKPFFPLAKNVVFRETQASAAKSILWFLKTKLSSEDGKRGPEKVRLRQAVMLAEYAVMIAGNCDFQEGKDLSVSLR